MSSIAPFYLLEESEPYQEKKFYTRLRKQIFEGTSGEVLSFDTKTHSVEEILEAANTFSMFSPRRLIQVVQGKDLKEDQEEALLHYIQKPNPTTTVVWKMKKLDKRKKFSKQVASLNVLISFVQPKPGEVGEWLDRIAKEIGVTLDRSAKTVMAEFIGTNLTKIEQEMEKLLMYAHPRTEIQIADVHAVVLKSHGDDVFSFTDQVVGGQTGKAFETLGYLLEQGTVTLVLLSMLVRHFRILLKTQEALRLRIPSSQLASYAGVPPFLTQRYMDQCKKLSAAKCHQALNQLQDLDREFKSTGLSSRHLMEAAILKISKGPHARG